MSCFPDLFVFVANRLNGDYKLTAYCTWDCWASSSTHHGCLLCVTRAPPPLHELSHCSAQRCVIVHLFLPLLECVRINYPNNLSKLLTLTLSLSFVVFFILFWCAWQALLGRGFHGNCMLNRHAWCLRVNHRQRRHSPLWSDGHKKTKVRCRHRGVPVIFLSLWWRVVRCFGFSFWLSEEEPLKMHWGKWGIIHAEEI